MKRVEKARRHLRAELSGRGGLPASRVAGAHLGNTMVLDPDARLGERYFSRGNRSQTTCRRTRLLVMDHAGVLALLATLYESYETGDTSRWAEYLAPDVVCIGTDEAEWWQGREAILSAARAQLGEMSNAGIRVTPGDAVIADRGSFVLVADRPALHLPDGTVAAVRLTLALSRVEEVLLIEQMHMSVPAPNEEVIHQTLPV
jgi:hypothetical protein